MQTFANEPKLAKLLREQMLTPVWYHKKIRWLFLYVCNSLIVVSGLPTLCLRKVWKPCKVCNVHVTTGHKPVQAQEEPAG